MRLFAGGAALAVVGVGAQAQVYTFDSLVHGEIVYDAAQPLVGGQFEPALSISGVNPNRAHDIVAAYDTLQAGADPDLQGPPWSGGNLAVSQTEVVLARALILAENDTGSDDGILDNPDDEGARPSGSMTFEFATPIDRFGFDVIDIEGMVEASMLEFFLAGSSIGTVNFSEFITNGSAYYDPSVQFGNNTANRISPITAASLGAIAFDEVRLDIGGSSAYDNIAIPTPASLLVLAPAALARRRR